MTFQFAHHHILNLKQKEKDQAYSELGLSLQKKDQILTELKTAILEKDSWIKRWEQETENTIAVMKQRNDYLEFLNQKLKKIEERIVHADKEIEVKKRAYFSKQMDEKTWQHLRDKSFAEFVQKQKKLEQDFLDEMAIIRHYQQGREG